MRFGGLAALLVALVACAKGGGGDPQVQNDALTVQDDAPPADTPAADAPIDMVEPHNDAPPDAPPAVPDACVPAEVEHLANPVFDLAPAGVGWTEVPMPNIPGGPFPIITSDVSAGLNPQSAPNHAWLGGLTAADASPPRATISDQVFQDVTLPADTSLVTVSGFFAGQTNEGAGVFDRFSLDIVQTNGTVIENVLKLDNSNVNNSYAPFVKTIGAPLAGKTVRLRMTSTHDDSFVTNFFIDSLSLKATHCP